MPTSFIAFTAKGFSSVTGLVPALIALFPFGAYLLKNPSAIWLLAAFSMQTKRIVFSGSFLNISLVCYCSNNHACYLSSRLIIVHVKLFIQNL